MKKIHFFAAIQLIAFTSLLLVSCNKSSSYNNTPAPPATSGANISMYNMAFSPASKTVTKGTVVKWKNDDSYAHTVTSNDGTSFNSGTINGGATFTYTANAVGSFEYHCTIHGVAMSGTLTVTQ